MRSRALRYRLYRNATMSCFPDGGAAPPTLSYASPQSWTYGAAISTLSPTTTGATSFAVQSGTLPTGVSLNASTGDITGTPTVAKVAANVVIRATGPGGTADATINIAVPSPLYTSLVDYWNLDEASGSRAGSHAGLTLTDNNTVTSQATGGPDGGQCAQFTAANTEYLSRASEAALQTGSFDFTVAAFAYADSSPAAMYIAGKWGGSTNEWVLERLSAGPNFRFYVGSAAASQFAAKAAPATGNWALVIGEFDLAASLVRIYVNNGTAGVSSAGSVAPTAGNSAFHVGALAGASTWDGREAYFGYWKRKLTAAEKTWLYNSGAGRAYSALATYDGG